MSTSYGYLCITDGSRSPCDIDRIDYVLRDLASVRTQLAEVMAADSHGYFEFRLMAYSGHDAISFLIEHAHHQIALLDEYGHIEALDNLVEST